jgi:hypothetical protein
MFNRLSKIRIPFRSIRKFSSGSDDSIAQKAWLSAGLAAVVCGGALMYYQHEKNKMPGNGNN